jgi:hypothetical protein
LCALLILLGCANYKITHELEQPIDRAGICYIGEIHDELPLDFEEEDKPSFLLHQHTPHYRRKGQDVTGDYFGEYYKLPKPTRQSDWLSEQEVECRKPLRII